MTIQSISVPQSLAYVLENAGSRNGVDFDYLLKTAMRESSLNPKAKAQTSSATGLFQFLESTWLQVMKDEGPRLGYQNYANAITKTGDGDFTVKDPQLRLEILALREDPQISADLAAAFTKNNGDYLARTFGRNPSAGELYIAHFLGAQGAEKLFRAGLTDPDQIAANLFPKQAAANTAIFYEGGQARTIRQVYKALVAKHEAPANVDPNFAAQQIAQGQRPVEQALPSRFSRDDMSFTALFSTGATGAEGSPMLSPSASAGAGAGEPTSRFFTQLYSQ